MSPNRQLDVRATRALSARSADARPAAVRSLLAGVSYVWRIFATCFAFLLFNLGGVLLALTAITICRCLPGDRAAKEHRVQRVVHFIFRGFIGLLVLLGLLTYSNAGIERLRSARGVLVIANHPTLLDVVFLIAAMPRVDCVVKGAVWHNVSMRGTVRAAGYIPNDGGAELVDACAERLRRGRNVLLFPEGTRSPAGSLRPFQRGAARIALRSGCAIVPVVITCDPPALEKGAPWYRIPRRRPHFTLSAHDPIAGAGEGREETALEARRLTATIEAFFT